jgi:hypothetical protein
MSIATLKRKSNRFIQPISSSSSGFSLQGGHRNQGWVGQTTISRGSGSTARTIFKGTEPVGHGGTLGNYSISIIQNTNELPSNDPSIIKSSTKTTSGLISSRITNPTNTLNCEGNRCGPEWNNYNRVHWVKSFNPETRSQGTYLTNKKVKSYSCSTSTSASLTPSNTDGSPATAGTNENCGDTYMIGSRRFTRAKYHKDTHTSILSSSDYTNTRLLQKNCLPTPDNKQHFPVSIQTSSRCRQDVSTPQEAIQVGYLPTDWMGATQSPL